MPVEDILDREASSREWKWRHWAPVAGFCLALLTWAVPGHAATYRVGSDLGSCDFTSLSTALSVAANGDELLLENMTFVGSSGSHFNISAKSLTIIGGYEDCTTPLPTTGRSLLMGGGADTVVEIFGSGEHTVWLENLRISGGEDDSDDGGGLAIAGDFDVTLLNVTIFSNSSERGGGIFINGSSGATLSLGASGIFDNSATVAGGGIYCHNGGTIELNAPTSVSQNTTAGDGGGLWLGSGCRLDLYGSLNGDGGDVAIELNEANGDGGGIFVDGAFVRGLGGTHRTVIINFNIAGMGAGFGTGGGVYITGTQARLDLDRSRLSSNQADQGGGFYADGPTVEVTLSQFGPCSASLQSGLCSLIFANRAPFAAGLAVVNGAQVDLELTWIWNNRGSSGIASEAPIAFVATGGRLIMEGCLIVNNGIDVGTGSGIVDTGGFVQTENSTFYGNYGLDELFWVGGSFSGQSSIFDTDSGSLFQVVGSANWSLSCAVVAPGPTLPPGGINIVVADPGLTDPPTFDFHLDADSPAIDLCAGFFPGLDADLDFQHRLSGADLDAGADEFDWPLFGDGFESGDLTAWSSATP